MSLVVAKREGNEPPVFEPAYKAYRPIGRILEGWQARDRETVFEGPADTGKSRGWLEYLHACMVKYPNAQGAIVRKARVSITPSAMATFERLVLPQGGARKWHDQEYRYPNGSKIYLLGLDDPEKIKSAELDVAYVQEMSELDLEDWEILTTRVTGRGAVMPYVRLLGDLNPTDPGFWLYEREKAGKVNVINVTHEDNPTITPERMAALDALTGYRYKRLRLGLRVAAEGMFFDEWDPEVHTISAAAFAEKVRPDWSRWTATDWGFADPFCCLWFARANDPQRTIYVYRELYSPGLHDDEQAMLIKDRSTGEKIVLHAGDPSMFNARSESKRQPIADVYRDNGIELEKANNARKPGWGAVRRALGRTRSDARLVVVREACPNLIRTMPIQVHDALDPEDLADKVKHKKTEDHAADALRYGLMAEEGMWQNREIGNAMKHGIGLAFRASGMSDGRQEPTWPK